MKKCPLHPKYETKRKPVSRCSQCWQLWRQALSDMLRESQRMINMIDNDDWSPESHPKEQQ